MTVLSTLAAFLLFFLAAYAQGISAIGYADNPHARMGMYTVE